MPSSTHYSFTFEIERKFQNEYGREWLRNNTHLPIIFIAMYLLFIIFLGRRFMQERKPFDLKNLLFIWNLCLAIFSTFGAWRSVTEFTRTLGVNGLHHAICVDDKEDGPHAFWSFAFVASKLIELGDTLFIVLRKTDLIFLHWWHHITVIIFGWWSSIGADLSLGRWIMTMNFVVHSLMYSYYAAKCVGIRVWKPLAMSITSLQILQMFVGIFVVGYASVTQLMGSICQTDPSSLLIGCVCYGSYFILFLRFFFNVYFRSQKKGKHSIEEKLIFEQKKQPSKDSNENMIKEKTW
jgi:hypothetical protein